MTTGRNRSKMRDGIIYSLAACRSAKRGLLLICAAAVAARVALPFLSILMPKVVLDEIMAKSTPERFLITVGGMAMLLVVVNFIKAFTDKTTESSVGIVIISKLDIEKLDKRMNMDYEQLENPDFIAVQEKADKAMYSNHAPAMNIPKVIVELLSNSFGFLLYAGTIVLVHPLILLILLITAGINWLMLTLARRYMEKTRDTRSKFVKRLSALRDTLHRPSAAKDIRLYGAVAWLSPFYRSQYSEYRNAERKVLTKNMHTGLVDALMILLRDGAAYAFLIWLVINGRMTLGDFVLVFAAIGALSGWVAGILTAGSDLSKACLEMGDIIAEQDFADKMNTGVGINLPTVSELPPTIEMRNVSYIYPNAEGETLRDINITIKGGERLAIVGVNGAGKTTLIKLICGLHMPTRGEVLVNGNLITAYNRDEYYTLISAVFQDIHLMASSILENISGQLEKDTDRERVLHCIELTGLKDKTEKLANKEDTLLVRAVHADAIELSGGERQKLAMARALHKDSPILILDEPTAALDPLAESEVYRKYAELTEGKTSIFISHRLASTRFCDRILLIDNSVIAEQGTHDELMAKGGIYADMFNVQASYYQ